MSKSYFASLLPLSNERSYENYYKEGGKQLVEARIENGMQEYYQKVEQYYIKALQYFGASITATEDERSIKKSLKFIEVIEQESAKILQLNISSKLIRNGMLGNYCKEATEFLLWDLHDRNGGKIENNFLVPMLESFSKIPKKSKKQKKSEKSGKEVCYRELYKLIISKHNYYAKEKNWQKESEWWGYFRDLVGFGVRSKDPVLKTVEVECRQEAMIAEQANSSTDLVQYHIDLKRSIMFEQDPHNLSTAVLWLVENFQQLEKNPTCRQIESLVDGVLLGKSKKESRAAFVVLGDYYKQKQDLITAELWFARCVESKFMSIQKAISNCELAEIWSKGGDLSGKSEQIKEAYREGLEDLYLIAQGNLHSGEVVNAKLVFNRFRQYYGKIDPRLSGVKAKFAVKYINISRELYKKWLSLGNQAYNKKRYRESFDYFQDCLDITEEAEKIVDLLDFIKAVRGHIKYRPLQGGLEQKGRVCLKVGYYQQAAMLFLEAIYNVVAVEERESLWLKVLNHMGHNLDDGGKRRYYVGLYNEIYSRTHRFTFDLSWDNELMWFEYLARCIRYCNNSKDKEVQKIIADCVKTAKERLEDFAKVYKAKTGAATESLVMRYFRLKQLIISEKNTYKICNIIVTLIGLWKKFTKNLDVRQVDRLVSGCLTGKDNSTQAFTLFIIGMSFKDHGKINMAEHFFLKSMDLPEDNTIKFRCYCRLAEIWKAQKKVEKAIEAYERGLEQLYSDAEKLYNDGGHGEAKILLEEFAYHFRDFKKDGPYKKVVVDFNEKNRNVLRMISAIEKDQVNVLKNVITDLPSGGRNRNGPTLHFLSGNPTHRRTRLGGSKGKDKDPTLPQDDPMDRGPEIL